MYYVAYLPICMMLLRFCVAVVPEKRDALACVTLKRQRRRRRRRSRADNEPEMYGDGWLGETLKEEDKKNDRQAIRQKRASRYIESRQPKGEYMQH